jgi:[ribosomal protein S18]-alanine N-acetyltransferase
MNPIRQLGPDDAAELARLHETTMDGPWSAESFADCLCDAQCDGFGILDVQQLKAAVLVRSVAEECELLMIFVDGASRRRRYGARLVAAALQAGVTRGAHVAFLEVAVDNMAAIALYRSLGFVEVGRRRGYYRRPAGGVDALLLSRSLPLDDGTPAS